MAIRPRVLFLCTENTCRTQMAEAFLRDLAGDELEIVSAGGEPGRLDPDAVTAMREAGIDISSAQAKVVDPYLRERFHYVITLCDRAREHCPRFDFSETMHWTFQDPAQIVDAVSRKRAFDQVFAGLSQRVRYLIIVDEKT